jgi:ribosomal protein L21E
MSVPGIADRHTKITPECRRRPNEELRMEVRDHVEESVSALLGTYDQDDDVTIHVAVTVER